MNLAILRTYAQKSNPTSLPASVLFSHTEQNLTIYDAFPKSAFHFLILPRTQHAPEIPVADLTSLRSLLKYDKTKAKSVIESMNNDAQAVVKEIQDEMMRLHGYTWEIYSGFHAVPSMLHLHLHVISSDFCSPSLKTKKHYNSFNPKGGFFLHLSEVLSWFEADSTYYETMSDLKESEFEPLLKEDMMCWRCEKHQKNIPTLKAHLEEERAKEERSEKGKIARKDAHNQKT